jgi:NAD(P)-dependent dehydrogenase (short-subunit alcohol dehydrogenase family)
MKTAIITGATKGIGLEIAKYFSNNGFSVLATGRTAKNSKKQETETLRFFEMDVRNLKSHELAVQEMLSWKGELTTYINNAGISVWKPLEEIDEAFFNEMIAVNTTGTLWGCKAAAKKMNSGSSIINISSLAGKRGSANNTAYCASKFAVNGITQSLAKELGPRGIRVNAICPVYVETAMILKELERPNSPAQGQNVQEYLKNFTKGNSALLRLPTAQDIADSCFYLASETARAITGQCINVDCGVLPQ